MATIYYNFITLKTRRRAGEKNGFHLLSLPLTQQYNSVVSHFFLIDCFLTMRDIVSCFNENGINVSHPSCSSYLNTACIKPGLTPSIPNSVPCVYKITLSTQKQILIIVTWCKNHSFQGLSLCLGDDP